MEGWVYPSVLAKVYGRSGKGHLRERYLRGHKESECADVPDQINGLLCWPVFVDVASRPSVA